MSDDKKWKVDEETRKKMSDAHRQAWERGERKAPITSLKEELADVKARLSRLEEKFSKLEGVIRKHRGTIEEGQKRLKPGNDFRGFLDDLMEAWEKPTD